MLASLGSVRPIGRRVCRVVASDFVYSWERALSPTLASEYAYQLYYIENGEAYNTRKIKDAKKLGDDKLMKTSLEDLESSIRLARMDLSELQALPLPSQ